MYSISCASCSERSACAGQQMAMQGMLAYCHWQMTAESASL
jgi:hypothetical protein